MNINQEGLVSSCLSYLLLSLLTVSMLSLFWLPIFTDEVTWLQMTGKYLQHGGYDVTLTPQCPITHKTSPPFYMIPYRVLSSSFSYLLDNPIYFRVIAIAKIAAIVIVSNMLLKVSYPQTSLSERLTPVLMTFSMGGLLVFFFYLRPEVSILMLTLFYLYFVFLYQEREKQPLILIFLSLAYLILIFSVHQKSLLLAPLVLIVLWREVENKNSLYSLLTLIAFSTLSIFTYKYYSGFFSCSQNHVVSNYWSNHGIPFYLLKESNYVDFLRNISWRLQESHQIFSNILFVNHSGRNFPPLPDYEKFIIPAYIASVSAIVLLLIMLFGFFSNIIIRKGEQRKFVNRKIYSCYFIVLAVLVSIAQKENYFYESIIPLFLVSLFSWSYLWFGKENHRYKTFIKAVGVPCSIVCVSFLVYSSTSFSQGWKLSMYGERHPKTFSHYNFHKTREKVNLLISRESFRKNNVWLVDELIATTLTNKKNIKIIHFSKIGVQSLDEVLSYSGTKIGIFNCHYLKGFDLKGIGIEKHDDICIVQKHT